MEVAVAARWSQRGKRQGGKVASGGGGNGGNGGAEEWQRDEMVTALGRGVQIMAETMR